MHRQPTIGWHSRFDIICHFCHAPHIGTLNRPYIGSRTGTPPCSLIHTLISRRRWSERRPTILVHYKCTSWCPLTWFKSPNFTSTQVRRTLKSIRVEQFADNQSFSEIVLQGFILFRPRTRDRTRWYRAVCCHVVLREDCSSCQDVAKRHRPRASSLRIHIG